MLDRLGPSKRYRQQTFITLLIYLNDDFEGGTTNYWAFHEGIHCRFLRDFVRVYRSIDQSIEPAIQSITHSCVIGVQATEPCDST